MSSTLAKGRIGGALNVGCRLSIVDGVDGDADVVANADDLAELSGENEHFRGRGMDFSGPSDTPAARTG